MVTRQSLGRHKVMAADSSLLADRPLVGDVVDAGAPSGASAFYGPLAAAMERIVGLAATALRAPFAFILLTGEDRRCFSAGPQRPDWTHHDTGALWRSGIVERITGGTVQMRDVMAELSADQRKAAATLEIGSLLGVPLTSTAGEVIGIFCAADPAPTLWNDDDAEMLRGFASAAVSDWELRRAVAEHEANERRLQFDASHDTLTGLANRAVLLSRLRAALDVSGTPSREPISSVAAALRWSGVSSAITSRICTVPPAIRSTMPERQSAPVSWCVQSGRWGPAEKQRRSSPVRRMNANGARRAVAARPTIRSMAAASGP